MIYVSTFVPDPEHQADSFCSVAWQRPDTLVLHEWLSSLRPGTVHVDLEGDIDAMQWLSVASGLRRSPH